jgi:O-antigen ligase
MAVLINDNRTGMLLRRRTEAGEEGKPRPAFHPPVRKRAAHRLAFIGIWLFTLLLYVRPAELAPGVFSAFPIVKIIAIITPLVYLSSKLMRRERMMNWTIELKMVLVIGALGVLMLPFAHAKEDTINVLSETFSKVIIIFALMIWLTDNRPRLRSLIYLVVICVTALAAGAVRSYLAGEFNEISGRIEGKVGGIFSNPNDLATSFCMLLPLAVALALARKGVTRYLLFACAGLMCVSTILTFSRGGFLGLAAVSVLLFWKLSRQHRLRTMAVATLVLAGVLVMLPGGYTQRLTTIFQIEQDETGSAQERKQVLIRAANLALRRPIFGIGMGNFHHHSIRELRAHNSYLEIAAELGWGGLLAYLVMIGAPLRSLRRLEKESREADEAATRNETWLLSVGLQGAFVAYLVCSMFSSIQYDWFIYYPVAWAVALRLIRQTELLGSSADQTANAILVRKQKGRGQLWQQRALPGRSSQLSLLERR